MRPILLLFPLLLAASPATQPSTPAPRPPDKILQLPNVTEIRSLHQGHEGSQVYVELTTSRLNVSRAIAALWPEFLTLTLLLILFRLRRRLTRRVGAEEHCRTCGYQLTGLPSNTCPECGTTLTPENRLIGRHHPAALRHFIFLPAAFLAVYFSVRSTLPRQFTLPPSLTFHSAPLADFVREHPNLHASQFIELHDEINLIDIPSGRRLKSIPLCKPSPRFSYIRYISPDHTRIFYLSWNVWELDNYINCFTVATGHVVSSPRISGPDYRVEDLWTSDGVRWFAATKSDRLIIRTFESPLPISEIQLERPNGAGDVVYHPVLNGAFTNIAGVAWDNSMMPRLCVWNCLDGRLIHHHPLMGYRDLYGYEMSHAATRLSIRNQWDKVSSFQVIDMESGLVVDCANSAERGILTPDGNWFVSVTSFRNTNLQLHRLPPKPATRPAPTNPPQN